MGRKPKAGSEKREEKTQAERFIETARAIGADETGSAFEQAVKKIAQPRLPGCTTKNPAELPKKPTS